MSSHKNIDKICLAVIAVALALTVLLMCMPVSEVTAVAKVLGYENKLFDDSYVHTIDIQMDNWDSFIDSCENEEYVMCDITIDGENLKNVGIRAKGNTSLSNVSSMNSDRYSFKVEFDQYDNAISYHGLDKLSLNNLIQDNTMMKDYLVYRMMGEFGADAPLCSYSYITVNGEDWGLYLAVEGVEDSFLQRNYGSDYGELYKPDSMSFGGGRGNGRDFNMEDFDFSGEENSETNGETTMPEGEIPSMPGNGRMPDMGGFDFSQFGEEMPDMGNFDPSQFGGEMPSMEDFNSGGMQMPDMGGGKGGGMGSDDVKLKYIDDDPDSYRNIFDNAKTDITSADEDRLISSLKSLSEGGDVSGCVDIESVIRYFVVHNFVVNGDSYTGSMVHNYYLYEEDGLLSMIPWDYNLAFGTFMGGSAQSSVNDPIDTPVSQGNDDRPMVAWIFESEGYTELYHEYFSEFIANYIDNRGLEAIIAETSEMIAPYVQKDPTKFCTYEDFEAGTDAIAEFCALRGESVKAQLAGTIPSTKEGQKADSAALIDTGDLDLSAMGTMGGGMGRGDMKMPGKSGFSTGNEQVAPSGDSSSEPNTGKNEESTSSEVPGMPPWNSGGSGQRTPQADMPKDGEFFGGMK